MTDGGDWAWQERPQLGLHPVPLRPLGLDGRLLGVDPGTEVRPRVGRLARRRGRVHQVGAAPAQLLLARRRASSASRSPPRAAFCFVPTRYAFAGNVAGYVVHDRGDGADPSPPRRAPTTRRRPRSVPRVAAAGPTPACPPRSPRRTSRPRRRRARARDERRAGDGLRHAQRPTAVTRGDRTPPARATRRTGTPCLRARACGAPGSTNRGQAAVLHTPPPSRGAGAARVLGLPRRRGHAGVPHQLSSRSARSPRLPPGTRVPRGRAALRRWRAPSLKVTSSEGLSLD